MLSGAAARRQLAADFSPAADLQRHRTGTVRLLSLPIFSRQSARGRAGRGAGVGGRLSGARPAGARTDGRVSSPGQPATRRPRFTGRPGAGRVSQLPAAETLRRECCRPPARDPLPARLARGGPPAAGRSGSPSIAASTQHTTPCGRIAESPLRAGVFRGLVRPATRRPARPRPPKPLELGCRGAGGPHRRADRPHRHRPAWPARWCSTCWTTRRAVRSRFSVEAVARGTGPATSALRPGRGGGRAGRSRLRPLAGRLLVPGRQRLSTQAGAGDVPRGRRQPGAGASSGKRSARRLAKTVAALVRGMREGQFPVSSATTDCTGPCAYRHRLPHQPDPFPGEDMAAAHRQGLTDQQQRALARGAFPWPCRPGPAAARPSC